MNGFTTAGLVLALPLADLILTSKLSQDSSLTILEEFSQHKNIDKYRITCNWKTRPKEARSIGLYAQELISTNPFVFYQYH